MTSFQTRSTDKRVWWEVQHRWPTHDHAYGRDSWSTSDITQFGEAGVALVRAARDANELDGLEWTSAAAAVEFLARFVLVAEYHKTVEFRVARITAEIVIGEVITAAPPPICGKYGYYGRRGSRRTVDLYCQQPPGHEGEHGPKEAAA